MLKITLYKNCILNETYQNVITTGIKNGENKSVLEKYLDTLTKKTYEFDNVYQENKGTLIFDLELTNSDNIYEYNYMKVETIDENIVKILRYCFIQKIEIINGLVNLSYIEDFWSSYSQKINGITESYLNRSRIKSYQNFNLSVLNLPYDYGGNKEPIINSVIGNNDLDDAKYNIIIELQYYEQVGEGEVNRREISYILLQRAINAQTLTPVNDLDILAAQDAIIKILKNSSNGYARDIFGTSTTYTDFNYEIGDIYIIPKEFEINVGSGYDFKFLKNDKSPLLEGVYTFSAIRLSPYGEFKKTKTILLQNDFKNVSIGTFSTQIPLLNNGNDRNISLLIATSKNEVSIKLSLDGSLYDITEDFNYKLPIEAITSEKLSQLKIARQIENANAQEDIKILTAEYNKSQVKSHTKFFLDAPAEFVSGHGVYGISGMLGGVSQAINSVAESATEKQIFDASKNKINNKLTEINAQAYVSNGSSFGNSKNICNSVYGIILLKIDSQNDNFVKKAINNLGNICYEFINDVSKINLLNGEIIGVQANYNVIKFESVNVYGGFTREIASILNTILESGIKIWYDENLQEDNYQVG